jgi:diacylglycerol kinase (ATP)
MKPLGLIVNPAANRGRGNMVGDRAIAAFKEIGIPTVDLSSTSAELAKAKAFEESETLSGIIAIGGDGTSQLGVNIAMETGLPLGLIPAGSGNDQVRELGIALNDPEGAAFNISEAMNKPRRVDVMWIETAYRSFWSLGSISAGFDALCAAKANTLTWPKGPNSYVAAMLLELPKFRPIQYRLVADGVERNFAAMLCGVANVKNFGGGMKISPSSEITDGELEVFILHEVSRAKLLQIFPKVYSGQHVNYPEVEIFKAKQIRVENKGFPISCDGEIIGPAPFSATVTPGGLTLLSR